VLTRDAEPSVLMDNVEDAGVVEVADGVTLWDLELIVPAPLEDLTDENSGVLLCWDMMRLEKDDIITALDDDLVLAGVAVEIRIVDSAVEAGILVEKSGLVCVVDVALSLGG
jgi:hypothetical protein